MSGDYLKLLNLSLKFLKYAGLSIDRNVIVLCIYVTIISFSTITLLTLAFMEFIWHYEDLDTLANVIATICPTWQILWMMCMYVIYFSKNQYLCKSIKIDLWPIDKFGEKMRCKQQEIIDKEVKWIKILAIFATISCMVSDIKPSFLSSNSLPFECYVPIDISESRNYLLIYIWQIFQTYINTIVLLAFHILFLTFITYLVTQFLMLKHAFSVLNTEDDTICLEKMKEYVDYHVKLLQLLNDVDNIYSLQLCMYFLTVTVAICIELYILAAAEFTDLLDSIKTMVCIADYMVFFFLLCYAGSEITKACEVADSIYNSGWEGKPHWYKSATKMIILQSQVPCVLKAGGIFELNLNSFTNVVNMSISVYTFLKGVKDKNL